MSVNDSSVLSRPRVLSDEIHWPTPVGAVEVLPANAYHTHHQAWLDARNDGIGGSDVAPILGLVGYESLIGVWLSKTGRRPPIEDNPLMERGRYLEPALAQYFSDMTGLRLKRTGTWAVDGCEWMRGNPDRFTSDGGVLEIKAPDTDDWGNSWTDGPALHAQAQLMWMLAILGLPHGYIAADGGRDGLKWWRLDRDERTIAWMINTCEPFWDDNVCRDIMPDIDGSTATRSALHESSKGIGICRPNGIAAYAEVPGSSAWARERRRLKTEIKAATDDLGVVENRIKAALLGAEILTDGGRPVIEWKYRKDQKTRVLGDPK